MNLNDFRRIVNRLFESDALSEDPAIEELIEKMLQDVPIERASLIRDALDVLKLKKRLSEDSWIEGLMHIQNTDVAFDNNGSKTLSWEKARDIIDQTQNMFNGSVLYRTMKDHQDVWVWEDSSPAAPVDRTRDPSREEPAPLDPNNLIHTAALQQNEIVGTLRERFRGMEYFNLNSVIRAVKGMGVPSPIAETLAQHFIDTHGWMFAGPDAEGNYRVKADDQAPAPRGTTTKDDYTNRFRSWIDTAGNQNLEN